MIYNTKSGRVKPKNLIECFNKVLNENGYSLTIEYTKKIGHAREIIKKLSNDVDLVISAGGDGTFSEVISGNLQRRHKLLIADLPLGTTNDIATMYGCKKDYIENLNILLNGEIKNIDVCKINDRAFIYFSGIGSFVNVTYQTPRRLKEKYGKIAYIIYAIRQFSGKLRSYNINYEIDGKRYNGSFSFIFVTNSSSFAGINDIYPDVKLDDNMFEVLLCNIKSKISLLKILSMIKKKDIRTIPNLKYYKTNNLKITFDNIPGESWCLDGEEMKHNNKKFNFYITKEINALVPKANINKLFV